MNKQMKKELVTYLNGRFKYLRECSTSVEGFFDEEYKRYAPQSKPNESTHEIRRALHDIVVNMTTFRYCFLIAVCSFVEDSLKKLGELVVPDYNQKIKNDHPHDGWFKKHIRLLKSTEIDVTPIDEQINLFEDIIIVRNAIVHQWGKVETSRNKGKLETIIGKYDWIEKKADGYIFLNDSTVPTALVAAREIAQHILEKDVK